MKLVFKDPTALRPLPIIKTFPRWSKESLEWSAFVDDIAEHGIKNPLLITDDDQVVDGETRRQGAKQLQLPQVPCRVVSDEEVHAIIIRELTLRRNMTKGQRAYTMAPMLQDAFAEFKKRQLSALKQGGKLPVPRSAGNGKKGYDEWVAEMGFGVELMRQVRWLYDQFKAFPEPALFGEETKPITIQDWVERNLFDPDKPMGISGINKAVGYFIETIKHPHKATGGAPQDAGKQLDLFNRVISDEIARWDYWDKFDAGTKADHFKSVRGKAALLPIDQCKALAEYHKRVAKEFHNAAKAAQKQQG